MQRTNESESTIAVLVADSCPMNCQLMTTALQRSRQHLTVVASAVEPTVILTAYSETKPDVCVVSSSLKSGLSAGFSVTRDLRTMDDQARVILLLDSSERNTIVDAFRSGALGVFSRQDPFETLCKSIHKVHQGQIWASNMQLRYLVESLTDVVRAPITNSHGISLLTRREQSLVQLVAEGRTNRDISRELKLSEHTVRNYLFKIFNKLGTSNRLELALYAIHQRDSKREQLVKPD
jgi:DNA-binding NarL/FixJ family response regulator